MNKTVATIISRIFDPFVMLAVIFVTLFYNSPVAVPAFILTILLPLALFVIAWKSKIIGDWDVSDRRQRPKILWTLVVIEIINCIVLKMYAAIPVLVVLTGFAAITQFWKISGHAMAAALATGILISRFGIAWWPVLLIVPFVGWARVVRHDHTIWQVVAGALYSWVLVYFLSS